MGFTKKRKIFFILIILVFLILISGCAKKPTCGKCQFIENNKCINYRCCNDTECNDNNDQTKDVCINFSTVNANCQNRLPAQCTAIKYEGDPSKKVDVVFIPVNFDSNQLGVFNNIIDESITKLFSIYPYSKYKSKFNFYRIDSIFNMGCENYTLGFREQWECDEEKLKQVANNCGAYDHIVIVVNSEFRGGSGNKKIIYFNSGNSGPSVFVHEFGGHALAHLQDQYVGDYNYNGVPNNQCNNLDHVCLKELNVIISRAPNIDSIGCPKWCANYKNYENECSRIINENECRCYNRFKEGDKCSIILSDPGCVWFDKPHPDFKTNCIPLRDYYNIGIDCLEGTGCYFGSLLGQFAWRPNKNREDSLMDFQDAGKFDPVSERQIEKVINCCYPDNCNNFPSLDCQKLAQDDYFLGCSTCKI
ncbi:hypothetical protein HYX16_00800 [Candidatus Woesearchaeota archaeon]|nr:hypothetical protein [Candidatus Woesearchaeota archaeon]